MAHRMGTIGGRGFGRRGRRGARMARLMRTALEALLVFEDRRRSRRHLLGLSEHMLKDLGLSRAEVEAETGKPFWLP
jgi:uncharacterized protein YjiS (DUF1127 family)